MGRDNDRQKALRHIYLALRCSKSCAELMDLKLDEESNSVACYYKNGYQHTIRLASNSIREMMGRISEEV